MRRRDETLRPEGALVWGGVLALLALGFGSGCSFDEVGCESNADCRSARLCQAGVCVDPDEAAPNNASADGGVIDDPDQAAPDNNIGGPDMDTDPPPQVDMRVDPPPVQDMNIEPPPPPPDMDIEPPPPPPDMNIEPPPLDMDVPPPPPPDMAPPEPDMAPPPEPDMMMPPEPDMAPPVLGPQVVVTPANTIDFGILTIGQSTTAQLLVENVGDAPLEVSSLDLFTRPSQGFDVQPVVMPAAPVLIPPGAAEIFTATFQPTVQGSYGNGIRVETNDADDPVVEVDLEGQAFPQASGKCLTATPDPLDFGLVSPGTTRTLQVQLGNCSSQESTTVTDIRLDDGTRGFTFAPGQQPPFSLAVGQSVTVDVTYMSPMVGQGEAADELFVFSDSQFGSRSEVALEADSGACPEPEIEGEALGDLLGVDIPQEELVVVGLGDEVELDATGSGSSSGQLIYDWTLTSAPMGSIAQLTTNGAATNGLLPDVAGTYEVELSVTDPVLGLPGCEVATLEIVAVDPDPSVRAEVIWDADHDVDLHVLRSDAMGNWPPFDDPNEDLHYENRAPDWGAAGVLADDGLHLGDDRDGFGPEVALVGQLEAGRDYRVIAHYARNDGGQPVRFTVTVSVEVTNPATGMVSAQTLPHEFFVFPRDRAWIAFDVDGDTGAISTVDQEITNP